MSAEGLNKWGATLRLGDLSPARTHAFSIEADAQAMAAIADELELSSVKKLRFEGTLVAAGKRDWRLEGMLGATVVQPCVVTLDPVTTRIDSPVGRTYLADFTDPAEATAEEEVEMPEDDTVEPLPATLSLSAVAIEALALAVPAYPRAEGAELGELRVTEPGKDPMSDEDVKPFAGLKALRDKLGGTD
ncbi:YceD family protein [Celeribacter sp.]|uniref:YceD family protein n=1 Tax=Celeribacter sp. TaxID=1890673 RepID=UPI003A923828